jgi:predicted nucleotide-binding protein (sugar kinase/HSP70/actin superfamily)
MGYMWVTTQHLLHAVTWVTTQHLLHAVTILSFHCVFSLDDKPVRNTYSKNLALTALYTEVKVAA